MVSKYIKELLENHNRVIVPDLGAFLYKGDDQKLIYFNEFLRFNDGLLLNYIAETEKIDQIEAAKKIKVFVEESNKKLQAKQQLVLEGVGTLFLDANEKIQLKAEQLLSYQFEEPAKEIIIERDEEPTATSDKDLLVIDHKADEPKSDLIVPPIKSKPVDKEPETEKIEEIKIEPPVQQVTKQTENIKPMPQAPKKQPVRTSRNPVPTKNAQTNKSILWIVGILVIAIMGIIYYFVIRPLYSDKNVNQNKIPYASSKPAKTVDTTSTKKVPVVVPTGKKYYLVAGCFVQEENANRMVTKLKNEGYNPEKFVKIEQMYFVSIASYTSKPEAETAMKNFKDKGYAELWIKYY